MSQTRDRGAKAKLPTFEDANFRLTVIDQLMSLGYFKTELSVSGARVKDFAFDRVVKRAVDKLAITHAMLAEVTSIAPDGGDKIYRALMPVQDGEGDQFLIRSLEDVALLPNLEEVHLFSLCAKGIDLTPLGDAPKLKKLSVSFGPSWTKGRKVLTALKKRGVEVG